MESTPSRPLQKRLCKRVIFTIGFAKLNGYNAELQLSCVIGIASYFTSFILLHLNTPDVPARMLYSSFVCLVIVDETIGGTVVGRNRGVAVEFR
jgi:hypothetical protein